jgi:UDP-2-acetamido-3-amino-2,3-dideoxy-glucuronate N-acetyltransferase
VCFTNDLHPRSVNPDGTIKSADDWVLSQTLISRGASLGANSTVVCGIIIGAWAMIGSGSVVTHNVPDYALVYGNPARLHGFVCPCGARLATGETNDSNFKATCTKCGSETLIPDKLWKSVK